MDHSSGKPLLPLIHSMVQRMLVKGWQIVKGKPLPTNAGSPDWQGKSIDGIKAILTFPFLAQISTS